MSCPTRDHSPKPANAPRAQTAPLRAREAAERSEAIEYVIRAIVKIGTKAARPRVEPGVDIVRTLRFVSLAEATSFLLLLIATAVKYGADSPQGVKVLGPVHGVLFIAYCALVILARERTGWDGRRTLLALAAGVLPFAPFFVERAWLRPAVPEQG